MKNLYLGVMSGTSLDGVDVVLCKINSQSCKLVYGDEFIFDKKLKSDILKAINSSITLQAIGEIDTKLAKLFATCINSFCKNNNIDKSKIKAIGLHGQTLWHQPDAKDAFSMQLTNASLLSVLTEVSVVSDFRQKDVALGGQGAPLTPAFHKEIFSKIKKKIVVLNIGGMANITIFGKTLLGYDTGCGNVLLDLWIKKTKDLPFDKDGKWAESGKVSAELLKNMLNEPYFLKKAPKSCGRELFNAKWLEDMLKYFSHLKSEDVQATLLELSVESIAREVRKTDAKLVAVCGGGAKNILLMEKLQERLNKKVVTSDEIGVSGDFLEAMAFAWLAYKRIHKEVVDIKSVTGAKENSILGCIYE